MNTNSQTIAPLTDSEQAAHTHGTDEANRRTLLSGLWWTATVGLIVAFTIWWGRSDLFDGMTEAWASLARIGATVVLIGLSAALNPWKAERCESCGHSR